MKIITTIAELRSAIAATKRAGKTIGFVPTMGALHEGHLTLVDASLAANDFTVVSIFVNPTQFGKGEDFDKYPRTFDADCALLAARSCDLVFAPDRESLFPHGFGTWVVSKESEDHILCGAHRPGHFRGVLTIVAKLFNLVQPDVAYFGQKDFQQGWLISRMVRDLDFPLTVAIMPTVREADGLALSSRNRYLTPEERQAALIIPKALKSAEALMAGGERERTVLETALRDILATESHFTLQYVELRDAETLALVPETLTGAIVIALAGHVGNTRLIDNTLVNVATLPLSPTLKEAAHVS